MKTDANGKRLVALFDILGFSVLVQNSPGKVQQVLRQFLDHANNTKNWNSDFGLLSFSDTIILYTKAPSRDSTLWHDMIALAREIFIACLVSEIPLRGVITFDDFNVEKHESASTDMFWGRALLAAAKVEKQFKSVGMCIIPESVCAFGFKSVDGIIAACPEDYMLKDNHLRLNPFYRIASLSECYSIDEAYRDFDPLIEREVQAYRYLKSEAEKPHPQDVLHKYRDALALAHDYLNLGLGIDNNQWTNSRIEEILRFTTE